MYHMRYARGYEKRGDYWAPLAALFVDKVAIQKDILENSWKAMNFKSRDDRGFIKS